MKMPAKTAFPARAGMNRLTAKLFQEVKSVSRTRGDEPDTLDGGDQSWGRSPHARG